MCSGMAAADLFFEIVGFFFGWFDASARFNLSQAEFYYSYFYYYFFQFVYLKGAGFGTGTFECF